MGIVELKYRAAEGSVLVRVESPPPSESGIITDPFREKRPDRGTIVDKSNAYGVENGQYYCFDQRGATQVDGDLWSIEIDSLLAELSPEGIRPISGRQE